MTNWFMTIVWLLPILFMVHDFEEIIMVTAWRKRNAKKLAALKRQPFGKAESTASLSCAVMEEFLLLSVLSLISIYYNRFLYFLVFRCLYDSFVFPHYSVHAF